MLNSFVVTRGPAKSGGLFVDLIMQEIKIVEISSREINESEVSDDHISENSGEQNKGTVQPEAQANQSWLLSIKKAFI